MEAREIKFRAWDGVRMRGTGKNDWFSLRSDGMISFGQADDPKVHLMQYTGLKDAKGVEIYEGDVVDGVILSDYSIHIGRVLFDFNGYRIVTKEKSLPLDLPEKLTVIGNIHQHPRLLEKTA